MDAINLTNNCRVDVIQGHTLKGGAATYRHISIAMMADAINRIPVRYYPEDSRTVGEVTLREIALTSTLLLNSTL